MQYRVRRGDSLWKIAEQQLGDPFLWPRIAELNRLKDPGVIAVGQRLQIPFRSGAAPLKKPSEPGGSLASPSAKKEAMTLAVPVVTMRTRKVHKTVPLYSTTGTVPTSRGLVPVEIKVCFEGEIEVLLKHGEIAVGDSEVTIETSQGEIKLKKDGIEQEYFTHCANRVGTVCSGIKVGVLTGDVMLGPSIKTTFFGQEHEVRLAVKSVYPLHLDGESSVKTKTEHEAFRFEITGKMTVTVAERPTESRPYPHTVPFLVKVGTGAAVAGAMVLAVLTLPATVTATAAVSMFAFISYETGRSSGDETEIQVRLNAR